MRGRTHLTVGCATWVGVNAAITGPHLWPLTLGTLAAGAGALLPDTDRHPAMRRITGGHRHATHSLLGLAAATILAVVADDLTPLPWWIVPALAIGWATHIVTDSMTIRGCPWLWPSQRRFWILPTPLLITTGGRRRENPRFLQHPRRPPYGEWVTSNAAVTLTAALCYLKWR